MNQALSDPTRTSPPRSGAWDVYGSVANPNRETEAMADGSDSLHHGGGVGMGFSRPRALERPGDRRDAPRRCRNTIALDCARENGLRLPGTLGN